MMTADDQYPEVFKMKSVTATNVEENQPAISKSFMVDNERQYELLVVDQEQQQQQLFHKYVFSIYLYLLYIVETFFCVEFYRQSWYSACHIPTSKRFYMILFLLLAISTSALVFVGYYTKNHGERVAIKRHGRMFMLSKPH